jgi:hypothetical protein
MGRGNKECKCNRGINFKSVIFKIDGSIIELKCTRSQFDWLVEYSDKKNCVV